ncbi:hypothetical protein [Amycolatopsis sp. Hca4]|uniref:hypothetical protein n=1 Tax=Amycolatopsis sp. Hca4 TaxID=2742131 RepID=UPI001591BA8E|nr:hypothetical protein [Amycolatopsis sp. Hca4]QKV79743.1 hypothetical protein HUT10_42560 [Amycolatopsis sp. Hca4]
MDNGPVLSSTRVAAGLLVAVVGTAWAVGGTDQLLRIGRLALVVLPVLFGVVAVVMVVRAAMPAGTAAGPVALLALAAGGLLAAALVFGWVSPANLTDTAAVAVTGGGLALALSRRRVHHELDAIIRRRAAMLLSRKELRIVGDAPEKCVVRAVLGGQVTLNLSEAEYPPGSDGIVVDITVWCGRVVISVPAGWQVQAGRVELARRMQYDGELEVLKSAERRVVLNLQGLGGFVGVRRGR